MTATVMKTATVAQGNVNVNFHAAVTVIAVLMKDAQKMLVCQPVKLSNAVLTVTAYPSPLTSIAHQVMSVSASMIAVIMVIAVVASSVLMNLVACWESV